MLQQTLDVDVVLKKAASEIVVQGENLRASARSHAAGLASPEFVGSPRSASAEDRTDGKHGRATARIDVEKPLADALDGMDDAPAEGGQASRIALNGSSMAQTFRTPRSARPSTSSTNRGRVPEGRQGVGGRGKQANQGAVGRRAGAHMQAGRAPMPERAEAVAQSSRTRRIRPSQTARGAAKLTHSLVPELRHADERHPDRSVGGLKVSARGECGKLRPKRRSGERARARRQRVQSAESGQTHGP
jgi:hypothetical protein